jgi:hypothetical protein
MVISKRINYPVITNLKYTKKYLTTPGKNTVLVKIETYDPRPDKLYAFVRYLDQRFADKMFDYIDARKHLIDPATGKPFRVYGPLREFFDTYDINYYEEYDFNTAWKRYQREIARREAENIQL